MRQYLIIILIVRFVIISYSTKTNTITLFLFMMHELIINLHIHTQYSDGHENHSAICKEAANCGLDAIITTDHNVLIQGINRYFEHNGKKVLLLTGEEVHDQSRKPQKNHLLVLGANTEVSTFADNPQELLKQIKYAGGLSFIAHPVDPELPLFNETNISWVDWSVSNFDGIEIWNGLSELKTVIRNKFDAIKYGFFPELVAHNPLPETLERWDKLLSKGNKVIAIGGSDSHALPVKMGFLKKTIFPYKFHFSAINTHLIASKQLTGDPEIDCTIIYSALRKGNAFIGYDLPRNTKGFRFTAQSNNKLAVMGDEIIIDKQPVSMEIKLPDPAEINLLRNGSVIRRISGAKMVFETTDPGIFRVEVYRKFRNKRRGWIFSNPIYVHNN
jgi:hypothetical protein